jgi:rod shape-determining protein MreD
MIRSILAPTFLSTLFLLIQTTWIKDGLFWGVIPDFALIVVIWVAYTTKKNQGVIVAFIVGMICDVLSSSPLGYFSFIYIMPAYMITMWKRVIELDSFVVPVLVGFGTTIIKALSSVLLLKLFGADIISAYSLTKVSLWVEAALNGAFAPILFFAMNRFKKVFIVKDGI